ncbi:RadC family protein [Haliscomenobacter hydrossis]|uniref:DNA repair protein RadC n=1 Tax=Haliscomenobacter hydrossis (strain ATCC 27775 / DSM 1100 / LMG 10767 / O) TaxID=760192 RepID=F4L1Z8_HALH1|nr:DNA repair protein RadC [Haliscomenobacter hydrossis]AEE50631.1 DNA repair protein RadC [Haliscomenobacter hydrossis DSM 1100]
MYHDPKERISIKGWAEEDRPREKLLLKGKKQLTDAELLAIILGSGNRDESALGLAQRILHAYDADLNELGRCSVKELSERFNGVGEAKAISIIAALELGHRRQLLPLQKRPLISSSKDAYLALAPLVLDLSTEEFWILLLNQANRMVGREKISAGGFSSTVVDARVIFKKALEYNAASIVLCHNHPSGNLRPSQADLDLTQSLRKAGLQLDILVQDHLIVSEAGYLSFADEGIF